MLAKEYIALRLQKYKADHGLSLEEMAARLGIPKSSLHEYLKGRGNLRADTIDLLVDKLGVTLAELFTEPGPDLERERRFIQTAQELGGLPPERRGEGVQLLAELATLFSV